MSQTTIKRLKMASISIFLLGAMTAAIAYSIKYARTQKPSPGFTMTSRQTFTPAKEGQPKLRATIERFQKSDGSWVLMHTYYNPDGTVERTDKGFGQLGRGVFQVSEEQKLLSFLSPMATNKSIISADAWETALRSDPRFVREEFVMGYKAMVLHMPEGDGSAYTEDYFAPALHGLSIKRVFVTPIGADIIEPTNITLGDPPESVFAEAPDYPVSYKHFEKKIEATEKSGKREAAEEMRQQLQKQKAAKD